MALLLFLAVFLGVVGLIIAVGLSAERTPRVRAALRRIEPLSHPRRGRLGVWIARDQRVPALVRLLPITAFVYWVTPIDFIPDFIPKVGLLDDRVALALALWCATTWAAQPLEEHLARIEFLHETDLARSADAASTPDAADSAPS